MQIINFQYFLPIIVILIWVYILSVFKRAEVHAWTFIWGSGGMFLISAIWLMPKVQDMTARIVAMIAGIFGKITGVFDVYFKFASIYVNTISGNVILKIDFECSGIIEILVFLSLIAFFRVYNITERIIVGTIGFVYIMLSNAIRIIVICYIIHWFGFESYYIAHTFIGRIVFYFLSLILYFYAFTRPQIIKMKIGNFSYGNNKKIT